MHSIKRRKKTPGGPVYIHLAPTLLDLAVSKALITAPECQDFKQEFMAQHVARTPNARLPSIKIHYSEHKGLKPHVRGPNKQT